MKSIRSSLLLFFKLLVLATGVLTVSATEVHAQAANGTFTLTHDTRWGGVLLPPGKYTFSLQSPGLPAQIVVRRAAGSQMAIVMPQTISANRLSPDSRLVLHSHEDGESFVSALYLGDLGLALYYAPPRMQVATPQTAKLSPIPDSQLSK